MNSFIFLIAFCGGLAAQNFDVVLANGHVMDPETNLDAVRNVGIRGGKIAAVSAQPLEGGRCSTRKVWW